MAFHYSPKIITDGLVLYLDAANTKSYPTTGTVWTDLSKSRNIGTLTNGSTFSIDNGGNIVFDGTNDYVITTTNTSLNLTSQLTLDCWFKSISLANLTHGDGLISKGLSTDGNSASYELLLAQSSSTNYPFFRLRLSSTVFYFPTNIPINLNVVTNVVCTYNGSTMRIYVNGVESGNGVSAVGSLEINSDPLTIGVRYNQRDGINNGLDSYFSGNIYSSKVYNISLTSNDILNNFNTTKSRFGL